MTDRAAARPGCAGFGWCQRGVDVMPDCHRQAQGSRPAISERLVCPGARVPRVRLALPLSSAPGSPSVGSLIDGSGPGSRPDIFAVNVRLIYALLRRGVWTNSGAFSVHRALIALPQVKALLRARPVTRSPAFPPRRAQARRRFTQVIHMVVHSKACNTFSSRAGRQQRVSMPVSARGGRHAGRGSGLGLDAIAHDGGHRMLAAHPAGQAARVPSRGTREPRPCSAGSPIIAARIPAVAGVPGLARRFLPGRIRQGPSMYEMEGPCLRRRAKPTS